MNFLIWRCAAGSDSRKAPRATRRPASALRLEELEPRLVLSPLPPGNLTATATATYEIDLVWTDNSSDETGFAIQRSNDGTNFAQVGTVGADVTAYADAGLAAGTTYYYRVDAYNDSGSSAYSNVAQNVARGPARQLAVTA